MNFKIRTASRITPSAVSSLNRMYERKTDATTVAPPRATFHETGLTR